MKNFIKHIPRQFKLPFFILGGLAVGLGLYTFYISRAYSYLSDEPATCVNCHVMTSYYQSWYHSSHAQWTTCNDCHVPQDHAAKKYAFKAKDGLYHAAVFTMRKEPQVIRAREASAAVVMNNCIRCHTQLNTEFVKTGMITYRDVKNGGGKACWDCHTSVPHTKISNLASSAAANVPFPASPTVWKKPLASNMPKWLKEMINK